MEWQNLPDNIEEHFGFVYLISKINTEGLPNEKLFYVGCKQFNSRTRKASKTSTRKKIIIKESDWKNYYGSSRELLEEIKRLGKDQFKREILHLASCKWELKYLEMYEQVQRKVLFDDRYFNGILNLRIGNCPAKLKAKYPI
jgi:hypothetical protein